ncbi:unnamed protein product, partial [Mesorhabditis belari]|uniref:Choline/carnitine acyltransferase domain-containing protein n=1 Tax=Mesorhabditis belari TaxID=2138241 RepID=A0AAF3ELK5_9BILA
MVIVGLKPTPISVLIKALNSYRWSKANAYLSVDQCLYALKPKTAMVMASPTKLSYEVNVKRYLKKLPKYELIFKNSIFPLTPNALIYITALMALLYSLGVSPLNTPIEFVNEFASTAISSSLTSQMISFTLVMLPTLITFVFLVRLSLTIMLYYHGWLFEEIGKPPSLSTKLFLLIITTINKNANFLSYRNLLPWLPIPSLKNTIPKYLESVQSFLSKEQYDLICQQANEFEKSGVASQLQNKLWMKWMISPNWVSDWWKEVVYMRGRDSLIYTNVASADIIFKQPTTIQAARGAVTTLLRIHFLHEAHETQKMKPIGLGPIPMCPTQYIDYNRSLRHPKHTSDVMERLPDAKHIVVNHNGAWYKVPVYTGKRLLRAAELEKVLQNIIDHPQEPVKGEAYLGALTGCSRDFWAEIKEKHFTKGINGASVRTIETALDVLYLDDEVREWDENDITKYEREYQRTLTGDGYKLWWDIPTCSIVSKNGRFTSNAEHSVCDALIHVHVREYIKYHEEFSGHYQADGHCAGSIDTVPSTERLHWELEQEILDAVDEAFVVSKAAADNLENAALVFFDYGKDFIKKARVSPDAYIQMALQMAYYKDQGRFDLTYEPAVMRMFRDGRTETVRSCSNHSCAFVKSMFDGKTTPTERLSLLKVACDRHQDYYRNAMAGKGVDRHLFGLYVVSKYYEISSPFLENVFSMSYALSSSQTPQHQSVEYSKVLNGQRNLFWPAGAFCCPDGSKYGVCYTIATTGDLLSFHIAGRREMQETNCSRFRKHILDSLKEMREMVELATEKTKI